METEVIHRYTHRSKNCTKSINHKNCKTSPQFIMFERKLEQLKPVHKINNDMVSNCP